MKTAVVGAVHSHRLPPSEEGDWLSLLYLVLHTHGPASPPVQRPAPKQPVLGVLPDRCGRTRTCLYETPAFALCVGPRTWNFGHVQTLCLWLGFRLSVALTRNSVPVRWHFRRALVPLTRLLLDKAQPTYSLPPTYCYVHRSSYQNPCPGYCQPLPGSWDHSVPDPESPFFHVTPVTQGKMPFLPFAPSHTSPRWPHPLPTPWHARGSGTGPRSS